MVRSDVVVSSAYYIYRGLNGESWILNGGFGSRTVSTYKDWKIVVVCCLEMCDYEIF